MRDLAIACPVLLSNPDFLQLEAAAACRSGRTLSTWPPWASRMPGIEGSAWHRTKGRMGMG
ncbi:MAG: hypothetical protein H6Q05_2151 [Acidobacteria bacterium]|nr:hypothetical protein [Acidobacteriota bacterium]